ncbi:MAG TPA: hypothetical protein VK139_04865 [Microbacteriaceae bacterium]|nr:hypothetical protein [Microbacteriaceae bacterium]
MEPTMLIATPMKNAARHLDRYFSNLETLEQDPKTISLGFLVSDSPDGTWEELQRRKPELEARYRRVTMRQKDFAFEVPFGLSRWSNVIQSQRRIVLAKSRNHLLFSALDDEEWVLWLDVDVASFPHDVVSQMWATGKSILHPNCVTAPGGRSFDGNAWRHSGTLFMHGMRGQGLVRLEGVGGTMLLIKGDIHRDGLVFPSYPYGRRSPYARIRNEVTGVGGGEYETEGLAHMAKDMGHETWGMPDLEIVHLPE